MSIFVKYGDDESKIVKYKRTQLENVKVIIARIADMMREQRELITDEGLDDLGGSDPLKRHPYKLKQILMLVAAGTDIF